MDWLQRSIPPNHLLRNNIVLLVCLLVLVLFFPLIAQKIKLLVNIMLTGIVLASIFSLNFAEKTRKVLFATGGSTIILLFISFLSDHRVWTLFAFFNMFVYQICIVFFMILHVSRSRDVNGTIILNAVNGYVLIGFLGALLLAMAEIVELYLFGIDTPLINYAGDALPTFYEYLYFSYVTVTTLGYGDITPANAVAKSIVIMIAISGQLYLTVLVAMLVGKYLSMNREEK
ncbi:MAG: hypothetical protein DRH90_15375 [Deltaproteobacteria bacterium]|nr:MAG: hypothetical protein DRH90_15375 [Deltaproteobacteria bacterium]